MKAKDMSENARQITGLALMVAVVAVLAFATFALGLQEEIAENLKIPNPLPSVPNWLLGLANAGIVIVLYGLLGLAGFWFARKLGIPPIFREGAGWMNWFLYPLLFGVILGIALIIGDRAFSSLVKWPGFPHPPFPMSLVASATAGIGEEILYRSFTMGFWAFVFSLILKGRRSAKSALWIGNGIGCLAFGAAHIPGTMILLGKASLAEIPPWVIAELFLLNGIVGLAAGERYMRDGLVAAVGVHFWTDIVWHGIWPFFSPV